MSNTQDNHITKLIINSLAELSQEILESVIHHNIVKGKDALLGIQNECKVLKNHLEKEVHTLPTAVPGIRKFTENGLKFTLGYYGVPDAKNQTFSQNTDEIFRVKGIKEAALGYVVQTVRVCGNTSVHSSEKSVHGELESQMVALNALYAAKHFYTSILASEMLVKPFKGINSDDLEDQLVKKTQSLTIKEKPLDIHNMNKDMRFKTIPSIQKPFNGKNNSQGGWSDVSDLKPIKSEQKLSENLSPPTNRLAKEKVLGCVRGAAGLTCSTNHVHSNRDIVYHSYTVLGATQCVQGDTCKHFGTKLKLKDGRRTDCCSFLHSDDASNTVKKRLALGWRLYSLGLINYEQIFSDEDISPDGTKNNQE